MVVPKKEGKIRLCLDIRAVNTTIKRQSHPITTLESIIDGSTRCKTFLQNRTSSSVLPDNIVVNETSQISQLCYRERADVV